MITQKVFTNDLEGRIDPHFYEPFFRTLNERLKKPSYKRLSDIVYLSNEVWNQKDFFENEFPYIEISEVDTLSGEINNIIYYDKRNAPSRAKMIVRENDIIVSSTRPHRGAIALIDKTKDGYIASTGFAVLRDLKTEDINRLYLYYFLRTSLSLNQMFQRSSGGSYPAITAEELKKLIIPIPSLDTQKKVVEIMQSAYKEKKRKLKQADELLNSIDDYVREQLGIDYTEPEEEKIYTVSSQDLRDNRQDPYYYNHKFTKLLNSIGNKLKMTSLADIVEGVFNGNTPAKDKYRESGKPIVKVACLKKNRIEWSNLTYAKEDKKLNKHLRDNDILLLSSAHQAEYLGKNPCLVEIPNDLKDKNITFVGELICIRPNINLVSPYYLLAILRLDEYHQLINREKRGQTSHIYPNDLEKIKIPLSDKGKQDAIAQELKDRLYKAEQLKKEASNSLEEAKKRVEQMILN